MKKIPDSSPSCSFPVARHLMRLVLLISVCSVAAGCGGGGASSYLDMAFDSDVKTTSTQAPEEGWAALARSDFAGAAKAFEAALAVERDDGVRLRLTEGLGWAVRGERGILAAESLFKAAAEVSKTAKVGLAMARMASGSTGDVNEAVRLLEETGMGEPGAVFTGERAGMVLDVEVHAVAALAYFLRANPGDDLRSAGHAARVRDLLPTSYSREADDTVKALVLMGLSI